MAWQAYRVDMRMKTIENKSAFVAIVHIWLTR